MASAVPLVRVLRAGLEESVHLGHVAVCDAAGRLVAWAGDPDRLVFGRSCEKPVQAAASLSAIGATEHLSDREVAIMCASHNGEPVHVAAVRTVLRRAGVTSDSLLNPPGWPLDVATMARSRHRTRLLHNCSGKHAGMLLACVRAGWDPAAYLRRSHPLQRRVSRAVSLGTDRDDLEFGVDGCGVPVHGVRVRDMATLFARLVRSERMGALRPAVDRAVGAMLSQPYLVGGRERVDTAVMTVTRGIVAKSGAEALECAAVSGSGLGVAVKIADGGWRAGGAALISVLDRIDALTPGQLRELAPFARPAVLGGDRRVGSLAADVVLRSPRAAGR